MEIEKIINGKCWVVYFDELGFKNSIRDFVEKYEEGHLDTFVKTHYRDILERAKREVEEHSELLPNIHHAWFSDTFIFYIPVNENDGSFHVILNLAQSFLLGCTWKKHPLRGALGVGDFHANKAENIFVGPALIDAHDYSEKQDWIGLVVTPKAYAEMQQITNLGNPNECEFVKYDVPIIIKTEKTKDRIVRETSAEKLFAFKMHRYNKIKNRIQEMFQVCKNRNSDDELK